MKQQNGQRLYIAVLNIETNAKNEAVPSIETNVDWSILPQSIQIVPVVYIPNHVFERIDKTAIEHFVKNLSHYFLNKIPPSVFFPEIQIDCDWTEKTRVAYFSFLEKLKLQVQKPISATIRLHQIKYRSKTGIPPVDKGALMMYNLNAPNKYSSQNSIFDANECEKYLKGQKRYDLPLDIALPVFSWGLVFRNKQYQGIFNGLSIDESKNLSFLNLNTEGGKNYFQVVQDTVFRGLYLRYGDEIEIEEVNENDLYDAAKLARPMLNNDTTNVVFYHLNSSIIKNLDAHVFQKVLNYLH
ncbi:MAG: hypothetical protein JNL70_11875 [Saprospiraceae bacterium]|nr:hypothetical protein [Saprospiraceae bacterium]